MQKANDQVEKILMRATNLKYVQKQSGRDFNYAGAAYFHIISHKLLRYSLNKWRVERVSNFCTVVAKGFWGFQQYKLVCSQESSSSAFDTV